MEYKNIKRILDVALAVNCSIILSPVLLVSAILVKNDSEGPIIFKQPRNGKDGRVFNIYKFRTMDQNNDVYNFNEKDMVTRVGKILRKYGIDELPQLFNILKGDMSFIGPRPYPLKYYDYLTDSQKQRFEVLPGLLGLSVCKYTDISILEKIDLDCLYVDNFSLRQDLEIIKQFICNLDKIFSSREKSSFGNKNTIINDFDCLKNNLQNDKNISLEHVKNQIIQNSNTDSFNGCVDFENYFVGDYVDCDKKPMQKKIGSK